MTPPWGYAAWAFIAVLCAGMHVVGLQEALADVAEVVKRRSKVREIYARTASRHEMGRLFFQLGSAVVASLGVLTPELVRLPNYAIGLFAVASIVFGMQSILDRKARHKLLHIGIRDEAGLDETPAADKVAHLPS